MDEFRATHRHRKGGLYQFLGYGIHSETDEAVAVYRDPLGVIWVRPREMFEDGRFAPLIAEPEAEGRQGWAQPILSR